MNKTQLTQQGYQQLTEELKELKNIKRPKCVDRLSKARSMGDLSENSEYTAAKEELNFTDKRIKELEEILKHAQIASTSTNHNLVELGNTVIVESQGEKKEFTIVGDYEADPVNKKLSTSSPIGKALLGKNVGDKVEIKTPAGKTIYKIIQIK